MCTLSANAVTGMPVHGHMRIHVLVLRQHIDSDVFFEKVILTMELSKRPAWMCQSEARESDSHKARGAPLPPHLHRD